MPETLFNKEFGAGWCPSDDAVSGRQNALLQMDNLHLDKNGALELINGTVLIGPGYPANAHTLFSRYMNKVRQDYLALSDGSVYRNDLAIVTGGDNANAAFGTAFDYTLVCSGSKRVKDNANTVVSLGVGKPTTAPVVTQALNDAPTANVGSYFADFVIPVGASATVVGGNYLQVTTNAAGMFVMQSYPPPSPSPFNCAQLLGATGPGDSTDIDFVILNGYTPNPFGVSIQFDILLQPGDAAGTQLTDFYTYTVRDISQQATFDAISGVFTIRMERSQFQRSGGQALDWSKVYGIRITIKAPQQIVVNIWAAAFGVNFFQFRGGTHAQFGTYQYLQVNVNNTGSYLAKSEAGPVSIPIVLDGVLARVNVQNPAGIDPQVNEIWIYRNGGNLGGTFYRIKVLKAPFSGFAFWDDMGDQEALNLDIELNIQLISIASITDKIYDIIGPIQGRWYYFTTNFMYPSEINNPDLVNPNVAVRTTGSGSETFLWARNVSASVCIIGTSVDCYLLTGTYATFPDGTIDIYYQSLGIKFPPISYDAVAYGGSVYYLGSDGWRMLVPTTFGATYSSQNNQLIVAPNTDKIYKGEASYGYQPPVNPSWPGGVRFPITVAKNKLWCFVTGTARYEVYDFMRQYWRPVSYELGDASACTSTQDGHVLAFFPQDKRLREVENSTTKLVDGQRQISFKVLFTYKDNGKPRQRKDTYTLKVRCWTGNGVLAFTLFDEKSNAIPFAPQILSPVASTEVTMDMSQVLGSRLPKAYQLQLYGFSDNMLIEDWSINYDARPEPLSFLRIYQSNLGTTSKKRLRMWPIVIDTRGNNVTFTPDVDGISQPSSTFNSNYKKTMEHYFTTDIFGVDYGATLYDPTGQMEVWSTGLDGGQGNAGLEIVQTLPVGKKFDQVGPLEIFRWGKIVRMALRTFSEGSQIPFKVYLSDNMIYSGVFNTTPNVEDEYIVDLPKGVSGRILRVELGPTSFVFSRYFMKFQVAISGSQEDTELRWLTVPGLSSTMAAGI